MADKDFEGKLRQILSVTEGLSRQIEWEETEGEWQAHIGDVVLEVWSNQSNQGGWHWQYSDEFDDGRRDVIDDGTAPSAEEAKRDAEQRYQADL